MVHPSVAEYGIEQHPGFLKDQMFCEAIATTRPLLGQEQTTLLCKSIKKARREEVGFRRTRDPECSRKDLREDV